MVTWGEAVLVLLLGKAPLFMKTINTCVGKRINQFPENKKQEMIFNESSWYNRKKEKICTYDKAREGSQVDDTKSAQISIGEESSDNGKAVGYGCPEEQYACSICALHMIPFHQVEDHVGYHPVAGDFLKWFIHFFISQNTQRRTRNISVSRLSVCVCVCVCV